MSYRQPNANLRITSGFDRELAKATSAIGRRVFRVDDMFKLENSPSLAGSILKRNPELRDRIWSQAESKDGLPRRYADFLEKQPELPKHLRVVAPGGGGLEALPHLVIYDFLNNKHVMKEQGHALLHVNDSLIRRLYAAIHGFEEPTAEDGPKLRKSEMSALVRDAVLLCTKQITTARLTAEEIDFFHEHLRDDFVRMIWGSLREVSGLTDPCRRREKFLASLEHELTRIRIHSSIGIGTLVDAVLTRLNVPEVSRYFVSALCGRDDSLRRRLYHVLHRPVLKKDRWAYHFIKKDI